MAIDAPTGGNSGDVSVGMDTNSVVSATTTTIVSGWFKNDVVNGGEYYWAVSLHGLSNSSTPGELNITWDRSTTDSVFRTSGAGITAGVWYHISVVLHSRGSTSVPQRLVYIGTIDTPPVEISVSTITTGGGSAVGSSVVKLLSVSNVNGIDGQAGQVMFVTTTATTASDIESGLEYDRWIYPLWAGTFSSLALAGTVDGKNTGLSRLAWVPCDGFGFDGTTLRTYTYVNGRNFTSTTAQTFASTNAGIVRTEEEPPRRYSTIPSMMPMLNPTLRR